MNPNLSGAQFSGPPPRLGREQRVRASHLNSIRGGSTRSPEQALDSLATSRPYPELPPSQPGMLKLMNRLSNGAYEHPRWHRHDN